ncbi:hypothetical protein [Varibaculum vaginae]|uniref:hypothetical protein n=1 Tax=Varibaculum vaginae TaxID=2364797 RepID=UPI000F07C026|nr:hypothetical protein [Varibaculum vaginae]
MAKLTVTQVAQRCLKLADQLKSQLADPRLQDLNSGIEQTRRTLSYGELPRWQVKRLVDTVALAAMLSGKGELAETVFGLWMKSGQSISQNPASLVVQAIPDLGKKGAGKVENYALPVPQSQSDSEPDSPSASTPPLTLVSPGNEGSVASVLSPQPQDSQEDEEGTQALEMSLAAMISEAYADVNQESANNAGAEDEESSPVDGQHSPATLDSANDLEPAVSATNWRVPNGEIPWIPMQDSANKTLTGGGSAVAESVTPVHNPSTAIRSVHRFPSRRSLQGEQATPELQPVKSKDGGSRPAPPPPQVAPPSPASPPPAAPQPTSLPPVSAAVPTAADSESPSTPAPEVASTPPAITESFPSPVISPAARSSVRPVPTSDVDLASAAGWEYFRSLGLDSQLNMSYEEFIARKKHVTSQVGEVQTAPVSSTPRSTFAEVEDDMPDSEALYGANLLKEASSPTDSALRRVAQSPLMPSPVPPAAPMKPREILAEADRQPSTRLIAIRVRGYFDYKPRFTRPKESLAEPAVAGSTESFAKSIIGAEGPMPLDFLARRLCQKYRIAYNEHRPDEAGRCLGPSLKLVPEPGMRTVWPVKIDPLTWNTALQSPIGLPRKLGSLTLTEVANALRWQISRTNSIERVEIVREAFRLLYGINSVTPQVTALCDRAISYGIANNMLAAGDGTLWLP